MNTWTEVLGFCMTSSYSEDSGPLFPKLLMTRSNKDGGLKTVDRCFRVSMDLVYTAVWSNAKSIKRNNHGKVAVSWSCRNLIAFTTGFRRIRFEDGHPISDTNANQKSSHLINGIHVVDPDCPWEVCSFSSDHEDPIHRLLWDGTGSKLLSVDTAGLCKVWAMKEHMINDWECITTADVGEGENLVAVSWIDTGTKILFFPGDAMHSTITDSFEERFTRMMVRPPYEEFPGRARDGLVAISESGLVCRVAIKPSVEIKRVCLATTRSRVAVADVAFTSSGKVIVAANEGHTCTAVQFYRVSLTPTGLTNSREISSTPLPSLFPHCRSELPDLSEYSVTNIQFVSKFSGETVLVCTTGPFGSCVKRWKMERVEISLHEKFQFQRPPHSAAAASPHTFRWSCLATYTDTAQVTCVATPRLPRPPRRMFSPSSSPEMTDSSQGLSYPVSALLLAYEDNKMKLLNSNSLVSQGTCYTRSKESEPVPKIARTGVTGGPECSTDSLGAVCYSPCCCCVVGVTKAGDLRLYKFQHPADVSLTHRLKRPLVDLLEYCLLTGWEWWDVLMAIHQGTSSDTVEVVFRQFSEEYNHQPIQLQRLLLARFRSMKASLFRCMKDGAGQAVDCYTRQLLFAIATLFKSLLPSQSSVDQLNKTHSVSEDVDKIVQALDNNDFVVESSSLLSVQPLVQWLTDLTMLVVVVFTGHQSKEALPGVSLIRDTNSLSLIREMLVLIRLWGQSTPGVLPCITPTADKNESLALMFKILTKIWLRSKQSTEEPEHEERLAVEAAPLLPNQLFLQNMQTPSLNRGVSGKTVSGHVRSSLYQFGHKPAMQSASNFQHPFASAILPAPPDGAHHLDVTRRIYLDASSDTTLKQCTRCNCLSLIHSASEQTVSRTWDQEWLKSCVCGGSWKRYAKKHEQTLAER